jgi:replicative DNA helicase
MGDVAAIGNMDGAVKVPFNHFKDISVIGEDKGVTTGFPELDERITTKGYPSGQMTIIEGYHKSGKSTLMISSYLRMAEAGLKVLYATFSDLSAQQIKRRMLRSLCGFVDRPRSDYLAQQFDYACRQLEDVWDVWVYDASDLDTGNDIETFCAWFKAKHSKIGFDAVFMDYAQEIQTRKKTHNEEERQREIATQIRVLASKTGVATIVGSQVTPGQGTNKTISKGSRAWEEKAGWVLLISEDRTNIGLEWSRFGGDRCKIPIRWNSRYLRFESMTEEPQNEL